MNPYEKIKELAKQRGISVRELEKRLGYSNGYFSKWKSVSPNSDGLSKVADYFGVSTDYLLGREEKRFEEVQAPQDIMAFFRLNTDNLDTDDIDELEDELKDYAEFLIQKAIEKKKRRGK